MDAIYKHTQVGYLMLIALGTGILFVLGTIFIQGGNWIPFTVLLLLVVCIILFATLTIEIQDNTLRWYFGPGFWRKQISLNEIQDCEVVRNRWYYGWGIRLTPYNTPQKLDKGIRWMLACHTKKEARYGKKHAQRTQWSF